MEEKNLAFAPLRDRRESRRHWTLIFATQGNQTRDELGTLAVFYKTAAELYMLAQDYTGGEHLCNEALRCFHKVHDFDCSGLIEGCEMLLNIAKSNKPKQAATPDKTAPSSGAGPSSA